METPDSVITFSGFILSLTTTAAVHFGDIADPNTGDKLTPNLQAAAQMIELIAMLQEKTKGNLTMEEKRHLENSLTELRFRFVQVFEKSQKKSAEAGQSAEAK